MPLVANTLAALQDALATLSPGDWVDIGCAAAVLFSIVLGGVRGLSGELPIWLGWVCGGLAGWCSYGPARDFLLTLGYLQTHPELTVAAGVVVAVLLAWGLATLVRMALERLFKAVSKKPADHVLGALAGLIRAALLLFFACAVLLLVPWKRGHRVFCHESRIGRFATPCTAELLVKVEGVFPKMALHRTRDPGEQVFDEESRATNNPPR